MKVVTTWKGKMAFAATNGKNAVTLDAKALFGGDDAGQTPKELLLSAICGCTAMDVVAFLRKDKVAPESFSVTAEAETVKTHPMIFSSVRLTFELSGSNLDPAKIENAVVLSQTKYCGVSAMVANASPIHYVIRVNGTEIAKGAAAFTF